MSRGSGELRQLVFERGAKLFRVVPEEQIAGKNEGEDRETRGEETNRPARPSNGTTAEGAYHDKYT